MMTDEEEERYFAYVLALAAEDPQLRVDRIRRDAMARARETIAQLYANSLEQPAPDEAPT
jgi:hypothetical protein